MLKWPAGVQQVAMLGIWGFNFFRKDTEATLNSLFHGREYD